MTEPVIRPRTDEDLKNCVDALARVHRSDRYPVHWPADPGQWLTPRRMIGAWTAVDDSGVLGHMALTRPTEALAAAAGQPARSLVSVARLFVSHDARRRGVATRLLDTAAEVAGDRRARAVLEVESGAAAAIALYERAGWSLLSRSTADWTAADGRAAQMLLYIAPTAVGTTDRVMLHQASRTTDPEPPVERPT
ncbi:GNAT family N-acetyltransferase [Peterkaempfera sp. SMS 1(5)a]|uniref:GNAT family N-acetyltransferase n=1 Tax=Peterkaempfera podocarpi TaxID=3232308 RepID=UPI00366D400A